MGIPLDSIGKESLGGMGGGATGRRQSTEKGIGLRRVEHAGVAVIDRSIDWNASFANHIWSIFWATAY